MKLTKNTYTKVKPGVTLIELTVVILVLLTLIAVLFVGAQIYKQGADRSACILNIRNIQLAVRSNENLNDDLAHSLGMPIAFNTEIFATATASNYLALPVCPLTPTMGYRLEANYPPTGTVVATCIPNGGEVTDNTVTPPVVTPAAGTGDHVPRNTATW